MKNWKSIVLTVIIVLLGAFSIVQAQIDEESVLSFDSKIQVNTDRSVSVEETIIYHTGPIEKHGIYRDVRLISSSGQDMKISEISVIDERGNSLMVKTTTKNKLFKIRIGDPDKTFKGQKTYIIKYRVSDAVVMFDDFDEIYWNVTGNEWNIPILFASAEVIFPDGEVSILQTSCYYGYYGSKNTCERTFSGLVSKFYSPKTLGSGSGMTVAVGFEKGFVVPPTNFETFISFIQKYLVIILGAISVIIVFLRLFFLWWTKGKDPKGTGVIVPQYGVPDGLIPIEVGGIMYQNVKPSHVSAEIIYLATKGYLKIEQIEIKIPLFGKDDYKLILLSEPVDLNELDKNLLSNIFGGIPAVGTSILISELRYKFLQSFKLLKKDTMKNLLSKGYYSSINFPERKIPDFWIVIPFLSFFVIFYVFQPYPYIIFIFLALFFILQIFFRSIIPAKTKKGILTKEHILGLRDYLQIAEKDRLEFHNAPDKKPEVFEKLLPFAMVLGVEKAWAKEFEGIYTTPPSWYEGSRSGVFSVVAFTSTVSNFSSFASSTLSSSPRGSGGGGFSGGGGGGGGGGGW